MTMSFAPSAMSTLLAGPANSQRIVSILFPHLATDRIARTRWGMSWRSRGRPDHPPLACAARIRNAMRLVALDEEAEAAGLRHDLGVAEARAMRPDLDIVEADPAADRAFLDALAGWADRYTPLVALDGDDGLFLDISGCAHLFGGERALLDDMLARLFHMGLDARGAISSAPGLSWALSRHLPGTIWTERDPRDVLAPLPVSALRLERIVCDGLVKAGLRQIGDIIDAPRAPLARRFGPTLMVRLDQALGLEEEPICPRRPVAELSVERRLVEPVTRQEDVLGLARHLAESLRPSLEARELGGRLFELMLFRVDGKVMRLAAGASSSLRDPARIAALFSARLAGLGDELDAGFGFETLRLNVLTSAPFQARQGDFSGEHLDDGSLAAFIDEVNARFGRQMLTVPVLHQSHLPERGSTLVALADTALPDHGTGKTGPPATSITRPLRLFVHPEPVEAVAEVPEGPPITFRWRRTMHRVTRAEGPERIAAEWWIDGETAPTRDYYRIEDMAGHRYWLYREGLYERETGSPRWFMHGVFA